MACYGAHDALGLSLFSCVGLTGAGMNCTQRQSPRRDESRGALIDEPAATRYRDSLRKFLRRPRCMRAGISSEKSSSRRSGIEVF